MRFLNYLHSLVVFLAAPALCVVDVSVGGEGQIAAFGLSTSSFDVWEDGVMKCNTPPQGLDGDVPCGNGRVKWHWGTIQGPIIVHYENYDNGIK